MARSSSAAKSGGISRVRFVMLEAELQNGEFGQITQAIQNALRPAHSGPSRMITSSLQQETAVREQIEPDDEFPSPEETEEAETITAANPVRPRSTRAKRYRSPQVVDVDLNTEFSLRAFAEGKRPASEAEKNLVVAAWFKEHREIDAVTMDHVYTCYRHMGWSTSMEDFGGTLRGLKHQQLMTTPSKGHYAINHLGLDRVQNLPKGSANS